jgi:hypothetical protein
MPATRTPGYRLEISGSANGRPGKGTVLALGPDGHTLDSGKADLNDDGARRKLAKHMAAKLGVDVEQLLGEVERAWHAKLDEHRRVQKLAEAGSPEAATLATVELLDDSPPMIRRPLCLAGGRAYAAAWVPGRRTVRQSAEKGVVVTHDPPLVTDEDALLVVAGDGTLYADGGVRGARPLGELGLPVRLPAKLPPGRGWSGAGVKRFVRGERPDSADVFRRVTFVVDRFIDFNRSVAPQTTLCEMTACYVLGTYLLDAFNVVGYLWPNGGPASGKTTFLDVVAETAYLGQVILAGGSYASLRDLADYGACLCFDDAEGVMDVRRTDPDKRALLLAGNRRGISVPMKHPTGERTWEIRYVDTFCPRCFSAIRLPDQVLGSRSTLVPLVRSGDPDRAKFTPQDHAAWPCDRRQLIDDLWALGLAWLPTMPDYDREAASLSPMVGRDLDRWRTVLAVALWLEERHGVGGLFERMSALSQTCQQERAEAGADAQVRVLVLALRGLADGPQDFEFGTSELAGAMNKVAQAEGLTEEDEGADDGAPPAQFTTPKRLGWLLRQQRFRRPPGKRPRLGRWATSAAEVEQLARAFNVPAARTGGV